MSYRVSEPGEYLASIKFNDEHIPNSPFRIYVGTGTAGGKHMSVAALQDKGLQVEIHRKFPFYFAHALF